MIEVNKYPLESFYSIGYLPEHEDLKPKVLAALEQAEVESLSATDSYYSDNIKRLDWQKARDFSRPWVQILKPAIDQYLNFVAVSSGYQSAIIEEFWFQQYGKHNEHGWHTHGHNFTGVYYLELHPDSPKTELVHPGTQDRKVVPDIKEGDILVFPSYTIHRAPIIGNDIRKTIVSFNFVFDLINPNLLQKLNRM